VTAGLFIGEVAKRLRTTVGIVRRMAERRLIPGAERPWGDGRWRFDEAALSRWLLERAAGGATCGDVTNVTNVTIVQDQTESQTLASACPPTRKAS
jgi:excisionase family DNA binding protein